MPELPDVEVFRRQLARNSLHRRVARVDVRDPRLLQGMSGRALARGLCGRALERTHRHGKHLVVDLTGGDVLVLHFGMTGHLLAGEGEAPGEEHVRVLLGFDDGHWLALVDQRRLGRVAVAESLAGHVADEGLGPDALEPAPAELRELLRAGRGALKPTLMDQSRVAGLGNIYTDEVLFHARLDPRSSTRSLDGAAARRLHRAVHHVVDVAVERRADPTALPRTWLLPHREDGAPCPRRRGTIRAFRSGGRRGYWCPECQGS